MSTSTDVVVQPSGRADAAVLSDIAGRVLRNHMLAKNLAQHAVIYAAKCGAELLAAKEFCKHGEFGPWLEKFCPAISNGTAHNYMSLAERMAARLGGKFPTVGNLAGPAPAQLEARYEQIAKLTLLQLPDPRDAEACARNPQLDAFTRATDGRTLTQLYMDFGIVSAPRIPGRHARAGAAVASSDSRAANKAASAEATVRDVIGTMNMLKVGDPLMLVSVKLLDDLDYARQELGRLLEQTRKARKRDAAKGGKR